MNKVSENKILAKLTAIMLWVMVLSISLLIVPFESINAELSKYITEARSLLWLVFIVSLSYFISRGIIELVTLANRKINIKTHNANLLKAVTCLDFSEKALLREFILQRKSVLNLPVSEPSVQQLLASGILTATNDKDSLSGKAPMMIAVDARPYITYKAVGLSKNKMTEEQIDQIMKARPKYARSMI